VDNIQRTCCFVAIALFAAIQWDWLWSHFPPKYHLAAQLIQGVLLLFIVILTGVMIWLDENRRRRSE